MGAWEPIIIQLDTSVVGDLHGEEGQQGGRWTERRQVEENQRWKERNQDQLWWLEEYKTNGLRFNWVLFQRCMCVSSPVGVWVACNSSLHLKTNARTVDSTLLD